MEEFYSRNRPDDAISVTWSTRDGQPGRLGAACFIHGMLEDEGTWRRLVATLDPERALQPHMPWSGRHGSHWGRQAEGAEWIRRLCDAYGDLPEIVVCHSFACNAMLEHLLLGFSPQPEVLILICPFYCANRSEVSWDMLISLAGGLEPLIAESIAVRDTRQRYRGSLGRDMVAKIRDRLGVYGWFEFLKVLLSSPELPLDQLHSRTLVISGQEDRYSTAHSGEMLAAALPRGRHLVIQDGAHFLQETHSGVLAAAISTFIEGQHP